MQVSFKHMIKSGEIKRADAMKIALDDIHEEPGFNLRVEGPELEASIDALAAHIADGGQVPALEVRPRDEGGVWVVDGHRRRRAYIKARANGAPVNLVSIVAFAGNDVDRVARIITSAEGRSLAPLEVAEGYKRLAAFGKTNAEIARMVGKTPAHVAQLLTLANSNNDVQAMVKDGTVSASVAVRAVRKDGDKAGKALAGALDKAKASGKAKVTDGVLKGKPLPPKVVKELEESATALALNLPAETHGTLKRAFDDGVQAVAGSMVQVPAGYLFGLINACTDAREARSAQAEKAREKAGKAAQGVLA